MAENGKSGCLSWIIILVVLGLIISGIEKCSSNHHKRQEIILPSYSSFKIDGGDPTVYFQTFDSQTMACLNFFWESGRSADMYVWIKDGNDLYDSDNSHCGYIIVNNDGSFNIKGWDMAKGHYEGVDGAIMSYKGKKSKQKETEDEDETDVPSWLFGVWKAKSTPVGEAIISIEGNRIKECIGGEINTGTFSVGKDYIQVSYDGGSGVRYELDVKNERLGLGDGYWLSKNQGKDADNTINRDSELIESVKKSFMLIPDHSKVSEKASEYMTKDLYDALEAAWDVPVWVDGEIGGEEFLFYFVTGNGGSTVGTIESVLITSEEKDKCEIELKYAEDWGNDTISQELSTISLVMVNNGEKWLLDDFQGGVKKECKDYILSEIKDFQSGKTRQYMKENQHDEWYSDEYIANVDSMFNDYLAKYKLYIEQIENR